MKIIRSLLFIFFLLAVYQMMAQAPQGFSYQAVVRDAEGVLLLNTNVGVQVSVTRDSVGGTLVYQELHQSGLQTNQNGLLTLVIGQGQPQWSTSFSQINWGDGPYYVQVGIDPDGGSNYTLSAASQLLSVPYALFAANTGGGDLPQGANEGDILYWNDNSWQILPIGSNYQKLCVCNGQLRWAPYEPSVNTVMAVHDVTESSARMEVEVVENGCAEGGPCISVSTDPNALSGSLFCSGSSGYFEPGVYTIYLDNLEPNTTYYARAFMGNMVGYDYGDVFSFTTEQFELPEIVLDEVVLRRLNYDTSFISANYDSLPQFRFRGDFSVSVISLGDASNAQLRLFWSFNEEVDMDDNPINAWGGNINSPGNYNASQDWYWFTLPQMTPNTNVYFRAFIIVNGSVISSNEIMVHTQGSEGSVGAAGGFIVYDKGVYTDGWRYLEIPPNELPDSVEWGCEGLSVGGLWYDAGLGAENTNLILQACNQQGIAADVCSDFNFGGYTDWFLPSWKEALIMVSSATALESIPDLENEYWTSGEEYWLSSAITVSAIEGSGWALKSDLRSVRPMRRY
jgi:hypothetical protein